MEPWRFPSWCMTPACQAVQINTWQQNLASHALLVVAAGRRSVMGRGRAKKLPRPQAPVASSQSFEQPRWTKRDIEASEGLELGQIFGHQIVASGDVLWCIGGFRPVEQVKISLLALDLSSLRWKDLTPPTNAVAPTWRWGHSACVLGKQAGPRPSRVSDLVMLCGGFDRNCNHNEVWHFCPDSGAFSQPPDALQRLPFHGAYHSLVHDTFSEEVYLFGGQRCVSGHYIYSNRALEETWRKSNLSTCSSFYPGFGSGVLIQNRGSSNVRCVCCTASSSSLWMEGSRVGIGKQQFISLD